MVCIGFEWLTSQALPLLPGYSFLISVHCGNKKIPASLGRDVYHDDLLLLPNNIITATGRINHLSRTSYYTLKAKQTRAGRLFSLPKQAEAPLVIEISTPPKMKLVNIERISYLHLIKEESATHKVPLYFDPLTIDKLDNGLFQIDLTHLLAKHIPILIDDQ